MISLTQAQLWSDQQKISFFFFLISKNDIYIYIYIYIWKATLCKKSTKQTGKLQEEKKKTKKIHNRKPNNRLITKERELRKEGRESLVMSPQARDQSKWVPLKEVDI